MTKLWITYQRHSSPCGGWIATDYAGNQFWGRTEDEAIIERARRGQQFPSSNYKLQPWHKH